MKIMLVADGRSPITRRWLEGLVALKHSVILVSTFPCPPALEVDQTHILPIAFGGMSGSQVESGEISSKQPGGVRRYISRYRSLFQAGRYLMGPLTLPKYGKVLSKLIEQNKPDLVHALRIPFEGMLASYIPDPMPLVVSIWGNDLTLHGSGSIMMRRLTEKVLHRANGLICDVQRDLRLAQFWGFDKNRPSLVVPTSGGIDMARIKRVRVDFRDTLAPNLPAGVPLVVNPRGLRPGYVRNDTFFKAIPRLIERGVRAHFICSSMAGQPEALHWINQLKVNNHVHLLPFLPQERMWYLFMQADISVSITIHDGTPNTLLEAMVCRSFPIAGDIESLREWITPGVNGLLVEPDKPQSLAEAILQVLENPSLKTRAAEINQQLIKEKAEISVVRSELEKFYQKVLR